MERYEKRILNALLDSYENSSMFRGGGQQDTPTGRRIQFTVTHKRLPAYFDESSAEYEVIHEAVMRMERRGFVKTLWKKGGILHKVILETERLEEVYSYVKRTPL